MITSTGVLLLRWFRLGVEDPDDLVWLLQFYHGQTGWNRNLVLAELQEARLAELGPTS